ncbi:hypothetical protein BJ165DRAFT_1610576 [Panaeolus papilionaceus]|nr:hypothetical protein BJ165DRAFT_1610576 [Panaeolus papilionaceus]
MSPHLASYTHHLSVASTDSRLLPHKTIMEPPELCRLQITGEISIAPVASRIPQSQPYPYLILFDYVHKILYLIPISDARLPGSRRRTMEMLQQFLGSYGDCESVTFVTTMWDTLHNEHIQQRAESNFAQLRDEVCKDFSGSHPLSIARFLNTKNSALHLIDAKWHPSIAFYHLGTSSFPTLYRDLHDCILNALQYKRTIEADLTQPETQTHAELRAIFQLNQKDNDETLTKLIGQLDGFRPIPEGFDVAHQHLLEALKNDIMLPSPPDPTHRIKESVDLLRKPDPNEGLASIRQDNNMNPPTASIIHGSSQTVAFAYDRDPTPPIPTTDANAERAPSSFGPHTRGNKWFKQRKD